MAKPRNGSRPAHGITAISVRGFKSIFSRTKLDIHRLTIISGSNSSGKSSFLQPLLLLKQTLEAPFDPGPLQMAGPLVDFTSAEQFLSRISNTRRAKSFEIGIELSRETWIYLKFRHVSAKGIVLDSMTHEVGGRTHTFKSRMTHDDIIKEFTNVEHVMSYYEAFGKEGELKLVIDRDRCFFGIGLKKRTERFSIGLSPAAPVGYELLSMIHLPALRGNPERSYRTSAVGGRYPGDFREYVASLIHTWSKTEDWRIEALTANLSKLKLTGTIETKTIDETRFEVRVGRKPATGKLSKDDLVNIADVGFGVSQTLPILVALLAADPGDIVYIEQPEIHLHPRAQAEMARVLAEAANRGVRVVIETHSSLLLLSIQGCIAEGIVDSDRVCLNWFTRNSNGETKVVEAKVDELGRFGDWPVDFGDVEMEIQSRFLDTIASKQ